MAFIPWQATIQTDTGAAVASASIEVRSTDTGTPLATLYSDATGTGLANPFTTEPDGFAQFYADVGQYTIAATANGSTQTFVVNLTLGIPHLATRGELVTWLVSNDLPDGAVVTAGGFQYVFDSAATAITDMGGVAPFGDVYPDHFAENVTPGTTNMATAWNARNGADADANYLTTAKVTHPDLRKSVKVDINSTAQTGYKIETVSDVRVTGKINTTGGTVNGLVIGAGVDGYTVGDLGIRSDGFSALVKPSEDYKLSITAATNANPGVLTVTAHGYSNGDLIKVSRLTGGTWDTLSGAFYTVRNATTDTFTLEDSGAAAVDTTALGTFTSGKVTGPGITAAQAENGLVYGSSVTGTATTTDVGFSFDGDNRNTTVFGNRVDNVQRSDSSRDAHAFAVAGKDGDDITYSTSYNMQFLGNVINDIDGNAFHAEDGIHNIGFSFNTARGVKTGIEVINNTAPVLHNYVGNMVDDASKYFVYSAGTGSSSSTNYAFNLFNNPGTMTGAYAVHIGQANTGVINYFGNMHRNIDIPVFQSSAKGPLQISHNGFEGGAAQVLEFTQAAAVATIGHNMFDGGSYGIKASATSISAPATLRGVLVESNNDFSGTASGPIVKANSHNIVGDQIAMSKVLDSNVASNDIVFIARGDGWLTGVTRVHASAGGGGTANAAFTVYKTNSSGDTTLLTNTVPRGGSQYDLFLWSSASTQVLDNTFARGDIIRITCNGGETAQTLFQIQLDFFYHT